jgi:VanZ family protein
MKKGDVLVLDVRINHEPLDFNKRLYATITNSNIIKVTIDQDESKLYIECLDYGESTISFNNLYKNNYKIKCYTKDGYVIANVGGLSLSQFVQKNLGHIACYVILGFLISLTIYAYFGFKDLNIKYYFIGMLITMTYGIITETLQHFIPERDMSTLDFLRNTLSVFLGFAIVYIVYLFRYYLKPKEIKLF